MVLNYEKGLEKAKELNPYIFSLMADYGFDINETTDAKTLDEYLGEYNWDDGFALPYLITNHPNCELSTAVNAFWLVEGYVYFSESFWSVSGTDDTKTHADWKEFVVFITENVLGGAYKKGSIPYPKRWAEELRVDIQKKQNGNPNDHVEPIFYGLGNAWA